MVVGIGEFAQVEAVWHLAEAVLIVRTAATFNVEQSAGHAGVENLASVLVFELV